jgi:hypothetical protein
MKLCVGVEEYSLLGCYTMQTLQNVILSPNFSVLQPEDYSHRCENLLSNQCISWITSKTAEATDISGTSEHIEGYYRCNKLYRFLHFFI